MTGGVIGWVAGVPDDVQGAVPHLVICDMDHEPQGLSCFQMGKFIIMITFKVNDHKFVFQHS